MTIPYRLKTDGWWLSDKIDWVGPTLPVCAPARAGISLAPPLPRDKRAGIASLGTDRATRTQGKGAGQWPRKS